jgi:hypothetical protein
VYSPKIIARNLSRASSLIREKYQLDPSWSLQRPSDDEHREMLTHLESLLDDKGIPTRKLTEMEALWVLCESTICKLDFHYYCKRYVKIEDWSGRIVPFTPNRAQRVVLTRMAQMEEKGLALMMMFLKARQLGITTLFQALLSHRVFLYRNVNAPTGSAEPDKSRKMVKKLEFIWKSMPWWLRPRQTAYRAGELLEYADLNSSIDVSWGNQTQGIGRGSTSTVCHLSELASFLNPEELVDASLIRTMHENPFSLLALESTAEGIGNWWHRTWEWNVKMAASGIARLEPIFLPWFMGSELYPTEGWLKRRPIPEGWQIPEYVERHAEAAKVYVSQTPMLRAELGDSWEMPIEQKWFYHMEYQEAKEKKTLHIFLSEMPANPSEAFQNSNPTVFDIETLSDVRTKAGAAVPVGTFKLGGRLVSGVYDFWTTQRDSKVVELKCLTPAGKLQETFQLVPVACDGWPDNDPEGKIRIWEWPQAGETYAVGCDPAEGVDQDSSVVTVIKKASPEHPDVQVAEFASAKVLPDDLWMWVYSLCHLYTVRKPSGGWNFPKAIIEVNISAGDKVQTEMRKRGWPSFHQRFDPTKIAGHSARNRAYQDQIGWKTDRANRPKIISAVRKSIRDGLLQVHSPELAMELATLEWNLDKKRIEASQGNHDDRVFALGIILASWYDPEVYGSVPHAWNGQRDWERELDVKLPYLGDVGIGTVPRPEMPKGMKVDGRQLYDKVTFQGVG